MAEQSESPRIISEKQQLENLIKGSEILAVKQCIKCKENKTSANFVASNSIIHQGSLPICNSCIAKIIYNAKDNEKWNTVDKICQWADIPFVPDEWDKIYKGYKDNAFSVYSSIFRNEEYQKLDWKMYNEAYLKLDEEERVDDALPRLKEEEERLLIQKWGNCYDAEELEYLENLHQGLLNSQNIVGALNEDQALKLCKISLIIEQKIRTGADFSKDLKAYDDLAKLANLTSKVVKDANEFNSVGEIFAYLEKTGFVNPYYDDVVRDEVDFSIKDIKYWLQYLYANETGIAEELEQRIQNLKSAAALSGNSFNEQEFRDYVKKQTIEPLKDNEEFELDI